MNRRIQNFLNKYIYTDELEFDARVFNLICVTGILALFVSAMGHIVEQSNIFLMFVKIAMILGAIFLFVCSNKFGLHKYGRLLVIIFFCDLLFPLVFITNGGSLGGMAAYFVLTITLIVLLARGAPFFLFMTIHIAIIITCYLVDRYRNELILPINEFQRYADNIISILVAGIFIGLVIKGLSALFIREQVKADAASKAKGDFLSNMSHEMRTPMNAIIGITTLLSASDDIEKHKEGMEKIETASRHLLGVINDILDMSKIEANKLELTDEPFDLEQMIDGVVTVMNDTMQSKRQTFVLTLDGKLPRYVLGDWQRLAQVVTNLLSNAVKFTPDGGRIELDARLIGEEERSAVIEMAVKDTGIGISEEQRKKLFQSFQQADASTSRKFGGTGLGLAISKRIVELMDGNIWVMSEPGSGSVFAFRVRLRKGEAPEEETTEEKNYDFSGKQILIAEDIDINREIITALLEPTNLSIDCAVNGREAVEKYLANPEKYDLIFMDVQMPEMDGYEATRRIRAADTRNIPIIAMTANVFKEDIERAHASGMNAHVGKPIVLDDVLEILAKYLNKK